MMMIPGWNCDQWTVRSGLRESTYKGYTHPLYDFMSQYSFIPTSGIDIKPLNSRQVLEEKQQVIAVRPIFSMFQQTGGIGNFMILHKEPIRTETAICCNKCFNGPLTLSGDQRGWIEALRAVRIEDKVTQPRGDRVPQEKFVVDHCMLGMNQRGVFM